MRKSLGILTILCCLSAVHAQERPAIKFGKITAADFAVNSPLIDSNTKAVILADIGSTVFEGNAKGGFATVFKRFRRVKILSKEGFDLGTVRLFFFRNNNQEERLDELKAITYNLENGEIVSTKLEKQDILEEKSQNKYTQKKFTFPALKEGSIIEFMYTIKSDFLFNLKPWDFQGKYPCLWSEYEVAIPEFYNYVLLSQGHLNFTERKTDIHSESFTLSNSLVTPSRFFNVTGNVLYNKWGVKDVPAIKEESYTSAINNHLARIEFQLSTIRMPNQPPQPYMSSWPKVAERMLESDDFGTAFTRQNGWLDDDLKLITTGANTPEAKARKIYEYVRDNFTCTSWVGVRLSEPNMLKDVFRKKSGRVAEINLLLLAMLRHENIASEPVLMSLRNRGWVHPQYPLMDRFNYLVCQVTLPSGNIYLDATHHMLGFGKLPALCYNGTAWVLTASPYSINLPADSLHESRRSSFILINDASGDMRGTVSTVLGETESEALREILLKTKTEEYSKELEKKTGVEASLDNLKFDSLKVYDEPVQLQYDLKFKFNDDVVYFNPLLGEAITKNPFISATRLYPVEMPFAFDKIFVLDMEVPKGYIVDELPKSVRYKFNEDEGLFEYVFSKTPEKIMMRCRMMMRVATFGQEEYEDLRNFFALIIKKEGELIVFKKQK